MAFGNGSHSLKRGFMRPGPGSRLPACLIIALVLGCTFLLYNVYTTTMDRNALLEDLSLLRTKLQTCQKDKTELEARFESQMNKYRSVKEDIEALRSVERTSVEAQNNLKKCKEQLTAVETEKAELNEGQKTDVESCQRKLKQAEEKFDPCEHDKLRLENEVQKLRADLAEALKSASAVKMPNDRGLSDLQQETAPIRVQNQDTVVHSGTTVDFDVPHRGAPGAGDKLSPVAIEQAALPGTGSQHEIPVDTNGTLKQAIDIQPSLTAQNTTTVNDAGGRNYNGFNKQQMERLNSNGVDTAGIQHKSTQVSLIANRSNESEDKKMNDYPVMPLPKMPEPTMKDGIGENGTGNDYEQVQAGAMQQEKQNDKHDRNELRRNRIEKERRLNKVIEESAPVDERRRVEPGQDRDRSRGEQDDTAQDNTPEIVSLKPAMAKRLSSAENVGKIDPERSVGLMNHAKPYAQAEHAMLGETRSKFKENSMTMPPPIGHDNGMAAVPGNPVNRKGLKDDYNYKDEEEENEGALFKNKGKAAVRIGEGRNERYQPDDARENADGDGMDGKQGIQDKAPMRFNREAQEDVNDPAGDR